VSYMRYPIFLGFDIVGGIAWGAGATLLGYFLGNNEFVHNNLEKIILAILFVSMIPAFVSVGRVYLNRRRERQKAKQRLPVPE
jgi:membrane-associated protein